MSSAMTPALRRRGLSLTAAAIAFCATISFAQTSNSTNPPAPTEIQVDTVTIGGPGSVGCQGTNDPALLSNGDPASATIQYRWNPSTGRLTLIVTNTSPFQANQRNPVLGNIYLNLPDGVTNAWIANQFASQSCAQPCYQLQRGCYSCECLGIFNARLKKLPTYDLRGSIARANAPLLPSPSSSMVRGPVTFRIQIESPIRNLYTVYSFSRLPSNPGAPGDHAVVAAGKFAGSGSGGGCTGGTTGQGCIGTRPCLPGTVENLGGACGAPTDPTLTVSAPIIGQVVNLRLESDFPNSHMWVLYSFGDFAPVIGPSTCVVHTDVLNPANFLTLFEGFTDANGDWEFNLPLPFDGNLLAPDPNNPNLTIPISFQGRVWFPGGPFQEGDHLTNGIRVRIGCE